MRYQIAGEARIQSELSQNPESILGSANPDYWWVKDLLMSGVFLPQ
jgi:hypothetical protein